MEDLAEIAGVELASIDAAMNLRDFKRDLRLSEIYYHLAPGLGHL
jgi:L-arabinose isomerase